MNQWGSDLHHLSLPLCTKLAAMLYATGDFQACKNVVDEVNLKAMDPTERSHVNFIWLEAVLSTGNIDEAFKYGIQVLEQLGVHFPRKPRKFHVMVGIIKTKLALRGKSDDQLVPSQWNTDRRMVDAENVMNLLAQVAFLSMRVEYYILMSTLLVLRWTLTNGAGICSADGFSKCWVLFATMGDFKLALRMGKVSLEVAEKYCPPAGIDPHVCFTNYVYFVHWRRPLHEGIDPILRAYEVGMDLGKMKDAALCAAAYIGIYFCCGLPLGPLLKEYGHVSPNDA